MDSSPPVGVYVIAIPLTLLLIWILYVNIRRSAKCLRCKTHLMPLDRGSSNSMDALNRELSVLVQAGLSHKLGYVCQKCKRMICHRCLESQSPKVCPLCGGNFGYLFK